MKIKHLVLTLLAALSLGASELSLKLHNAKPAVEWHNLQIVPSMHLVMSNAAWFYQLGPRLRQNGTEIFHKSDEGEIKLATSIDGYKLSCEIQLDVKADSKNIKYATVEIFLNRELFYDSLSKYMQQRQAEKRPGNLWGPYQNEPFTVECKYGILIFTPGPDAQLVMRDTSDRKWLAQEERTIALLFSAEKKPDRQLSEKLSFMIEFQPRPEAARQLDIEALAKAGRALEQIIPESAKSEFKPLLAEIQALPGNDHSVEDAAKRIKKFARNPELYPETYQEGILLPHPQKMEDAAGSFIFPEKLKIAAGDGTQYAADMLADELTRYRGIRCGEGETRIQLSLDGQQLPPEGYTLSVTPEQIKITGRDARGIIYGVQTLIQHIRSSGKDITAPCVKIIDYAAGDAMRGWFLPTSRDDSKYIKELVRRFFIRYKANMFTFGEASSGYMQWKSHPELAAPMAITNDYLRECVNYAKEHQLEVIPHVYGLTHSPELFKKRLELKEGKDGQSWCVSHPETRKLLADFFDEAVEIYRPRYFIVGVDELQSIGVCERCKARKMAQADLFAEHLNWCYDYLKKKNVSVLFAQDMFLERGKWGKTPANSTAEANVRGALDKMPKGMHIFHWDYSSTGSNIPAMDYLRNKGFKLLGATWYNPRNNYDMAAAVLKNKDLGLLSTAWDMDWNHLLDMTSIIGVTQMWNNGKPGFDELMRINPSEHAQHSMMPPQPSEMRGSVTVSLNIAPWCNRSLTDQPDGSGWNGKYDGTDLSMMPTGNQIWGGINFHIIEDHENNGLQCIGVGHKVEGFKYHIPGVKVNRKVRGLIFLHTGKGGFYRVRYADGSMVEIKLDRDNISDSEQPPITDTNQHQWNSRYIWKAKQVWRGVNPAGNRALVQAFEWLNPHPDKEIKTIDVVAGDPGTQTFLIALSLVIEE